MEKVNYWNPYKDQQVPGDQILGDSNRLRN